MSVDVVPASEAHVVIGWGKENYPTVKLTKCEDGIGVYVNSSASANPNWGAGRLITAEDLILALNELQDL